MMTECTILVGTLVVGYILGRWNTPSPVDTSIIMPMQIDPRVTAEEVRLRQENFQLRQTVHQLEHEIWHLKIKE